MFLSSMLWNQSIKNVQMLTWPKWPWLNKGFLPFPYNVIKHIFYTTFWKYYMETAHLICLVLFLVKDSFFYKGLNYLVNLWCFVNLILLKAFLEGLVSPSVSSGTTWTLITLFLFLYEFRQIVSPQLYRAGKQLLALGTLLQ